jgi:hypothetical protein
MTLKYLILLWPIGLLISCNNQPQESKVSIPSSKTSPLNCYKYINSNDTIILKTIYINGFVTGTLVYNLYQKDKNMGTIQGQMKGELLIADYSFISEGVQSVRQVAFKKHGKTFIEGYGETEYKKGKTTFKNIDSLDFNHSIVLSGIDCDK